MVIGESNWAASMSISLRILDYTTLLFQDLLLDIGESITFS
jgi:hypothetical protein